MKLHLRIALLLLFTIANAFSQTQEIDSTMWVTNGTISAITRSGNTIYVGGNFSYIGPPTGSGAILQTATGKLAPTPLLRIDGTVSAAVADGKGGWFIGGSFTKVQGVARNRLAHILADGTVDQSWNPSADREVASLALANNTLYAGGGFTTVNGQTRNRLAALDPATGGLRAWNPDANILVDVVVAAGNVVYVGGSFTLIGGQSRFGLAAVDAVTGQLTDWNPNCNDDVHTLALSGNVLYAGGYFTTIGGLAREHIAAIDVVTGRPTPWNPGADGYVRALAVSGNVVYAGGYFGTIGGQRRNQLAALDGATGQATPWDPQLRTDDGLSGGINALAVAGRVVLAGGAFSSIGGQDLLNFAALDATTGQAAPWRADAAQPVDVLAVAGAAVFAGGNFDSVGGLLRSSLAALDATTGQATDWYPQAGTGFRAIAVRDNVVYAAGSGFEDFVTGTRRTSLVALDATTGQVTPWNPLFDGRVYTMALVDNTLYVGGRFTFVSGQTRNRLAALDATTGQLTAWNPNANGQVNTLAAAGPVLYAGGEFTAIGGQARNRLAALDATTGQPTAWNPDANNPVDVVAASGSVIYAGGRFTAVGRQTRNRLAALDAATGRPTFWNPDANDVVGALAVRGNLVYAGGNFTALGGQKRERLAALDAATGQPTAWNPGPALRITALTTAGNVLYAGGGYSGSVFGYFAAFGRPITQLNYVRGLIYQDEDNDCTRDAGERGIANALVVAQPGEYFASTDSSGAYTLEVSDGSYTVQQIIPVHKQSFISQLCPADAGTHRAEFTGAGDTLRNKDFANRITLRPLLTISVSSTRRRRCFASTTTVFFANMGTLAAPGVKVHVQLPPYVVLKSASIPFAREEDQHYVFDVGTLVADGSGQFSIEDSVVCNDPSIRDLTQCTKAWITPANATTPGGDWDKSDVSLKAACLSNGRVRLGIYNAGEDNMADSSAFRILLDAQLAFAGKYQLARGDSLILQVPANGRTVRLEADQRPGHPTKEQTNVTVEACGTKGNGTVSKGFVAQLPQDDAEPEVAVECLPIIDSFDPNDKMVSPQGVTAQKYTPTRSRLDYVVRFQNTGTDYAYKVVVTDTLSPHLDISTLQVGAVSHAYTLSVSGKGRPVLTFTFNDINLPDSTRDQAGSNGFIRFSIRPKAGLPEKTRVENFADIFFDYNEPIRTNTTLNTIYDVPPVVNASVRLGADVVCTPNRQVQAGDNRTLCAQDSVHLRATAPAGGTGRWQRVSGGGTVQEPHNPATAVTGLAYGANVFEWRIPVNTCGTDSLRARVTITRLPQPATPAIIRLGTDSLACSVPAAAYAWYLDGTLLARATQHIKAERAGSYSVRVITPEGCQSEASPAFAYLPAPTAAEAAPDSRVVVYPNPTTGIVALLLPASLGPRVQVSVYDARGRIMVARSVTLPAAGEQKVELDLAAQPAGVFVLKLQTPRGIITRRIVRMGGR